MTGPILGAKGNWERRKWCRGREGGIPGNCPGPHPGVPRDPSQPCPVGPPGRAVLSSRALRSNCARNPPSPIGPKRGQHCEPGSIFPVAVGPTPGGAALGAGTVIPECRSPSLSLSCSFPCLWGVTNPRAAAEPRAQAGFPRKGRLGVRCPGLAGNGGLGVPRLTETRDPGAGRGGYPGKGVQGVLGQGKGVQGALELGKEMQGSPSAQE